MIRSLGLLVAMIATQYNAHEWDSILHYIEIARSRHHALRITAVASCIRQSVSSVLFVETKSQGVVENQQVFRDIFCS